jgi:3-hydroxybutyryl-CoA dehydrogenase
MISADTMNPQSRQAGSPGGASMTTVKKVAIIGAGQMGSGISHVISLGGYDVVLHDLNRDRAEAALATIHGNMARQIARGKISEEDRKRALQRIRIADSLEELGDADLVIEAATEDEDVKRRIFRTRFR